ncbi:hypothetical protein C8F04DRAFT_1245443 [Mycena alexandri]|uniref:Uncharacterized protein n=1 Tax=Mycena alexandri TaxID=1745969 RepID=A0AAD6RWT9_9AGAR|nr:hypothetical protein C8F04DRAFT_1245443 [Mycena alexandri]
MAKAWARQMAKRRKAEAEERRALVSTSIPPALSPPPPNRLLWLNARADDASRGIFPVWSFDENGNYIDELAPEPITVPPPLSWSNDFPATTVTTIHTVYTEPVTLISWKQLMKLVNKAVESTGLLPGLSTRLLNAFETPVISLLFTTLVMEVLLQTVHFVQRV